MAGHGSQRHEHAREDRLRLICAGERTIGCSGRRQRRARPRSQAPSQRPQPPAPVEGVGEGHLRQAELNAAALQVDSQEEGREREEGLDGGADIVVEPGQGQLLGPTAPAGGWRPLEDLYAKPGASEHQCGGKAVRARADDDGVNGALAGRAHRSSTRDSWATTTSWDVPRCAGKASRESSDRSGR